MMMTVVIERAPGLDQVQQLQSGYEKLCVITGANLHATVLDDEPVDAELFFHRVTSIGLTLRSNGGVYFIRADG
jgi:hypothetical protein